MKYLRSPGVSGLLVCTSLGLFATGCTQPVSETGDENVGSTAEAIRDMTSAEAVADFDQIVTSFRGLYGPLKFKEGRFGFNFESMAKDYRKKVAAATNDAERIGLYNKFLAEFHDAHISLQTSLASDSSHGVYAPLFAMPIEGKAIVYAVYPQLAGTRVQRGDEILSVDGKRVDAILQAVKPYSALGNDVASRHVWMQYLTYRPYFLPKAIRPASKTAHIELRDATGATYAIDTAWNSTDRVRNRSVTSSHTATQMGKEVAFSESVADIIHAELGNEGANDPFFLTAQVKQAFGITGSLRPSAASLAKFSLDPAVAAGFTFFATTYVAEGKRVLLLRIPSYETTDEVSAIKYLSALLDEYQPQVDTLVLDETHNPGGSVSYVGSIFNLLISSTKNGWVQRMHADRQWLGTYLDYADLLRQVGQTDLANTFEGWGNAIDTAYSARKPLSPVMNFTGTYTTEPDASFHWAKPFVLLDDELSASGADALPMLIKANHVAPIFGQNTMGAGGTVEPVATLANSGGSLSLTRGMFTTYRADGKYGDADFVENTGVTPDVRYSHTVSDFRAGYVGYVAAFSHEAVKAIPAAPAPVSTNP